MEGLVDPVAPLTERQAAILEVIDRSIRERGYAPTLREIGAHMKIKSTNGVSDHLMALERKGYLRRDRMKSRGLVLMRPSGLEAQLDRVLLAQVARVAPIEAVRAALAELGRRVLARGREAMEALDALRAELPEAPADAEEPRP